MVQNKYGRILFFCGDGSISARGSGRAHLSAAKMGLIGLARGLATEFAPDNIRVNVVSPGMVYFEGGVWNMVEKGNPEFFKQAVARNPTGRCATPQEVANAAVFLASPASSYTTGVNLLVDGTISRRVNF